MAFSLPAWKRRVLLPGNSRYNLQGAHLAITGVRYLLCLVLFCPFMHVIFPD